jgi:D-3-phosphoglycerate dehydrogenase
VNHIDCDAANTIGVKLITLQGEEQLLADIFSTAELTWGLLLSLSRRIGSAHSSVVNGLWDRDQFRGSDLRRKTIGIIGLGRLGNMVATYAQAFGMHTCYFDPLVESESHDKYHSLESLCSTADIITLHVSSTAENNSLLNEACFHAMKPSALFINTSRGELVDETALYNALCEGRIAGAAVDVLGEENDPKNMSSNLLKHYAGHHHNLIITPHIGGATKDSMQRTEMHLAKKLMVLASQ